MSLNRITRLVTPPDLPPDTRDTYHHYFRFSMLNAIVAGIMANTGLMATKGLSAADWHLGVKLECSSVGMFAALFLGGWMANRRKMPFVFVPGLLYACSAVAASFVLDPLWFLVVIGVGTAFEVSLRPAIMAIIRQNFPATHRGLVEGTTRKWSSLFFLTSILGSAYVLNRWKDIPHTVIPCQMLIAGALGVLAFFCFRQIRVREPANLQEQQKDAAGAIAEAARILRTDGRFRRYIFGCFLYGFSGLLYVAYIAAFLTKDLGFGYVSSAFFLHVVPALAAFMSTGALGRWFDRVNPWKAWAVVRTGWGLDPFILGATPMAATVFPPALFVLPFLARMSRGSTMGGSWVLWWRIGVNHFAAPGGDTSRYMGILTFMNGLMRLGAPLVGGWLLYRVSRVGILYIGGAGVLLSALYAYYEYRREMKDKHLATTDDFERQFEARANDEQSNID